MRKFTAPFLISLVILFAACNSVNKKEVTTDQKFGFYVQAFTSGTISVESPITVYLTTPISDADISGKKLFDFSPELEGEMVLLENRILEFHPDKPLFSNTIYHAEFLLGELVAVDKEYEKMPFQFSTIQQSISVNFDGLKSYDGIAINQMQYSGYILTADVMSAENAEKLLMAGFEGNEKEISWNHDPGSRKHFFTVDSLLRYPDKSGILKLKWDGNFLDIDKKGEEIVEVPALDKFEIIETTVKIDQGQYIQIRFSDPLLKNQNLDGLVRLNDGTGLRLEMEGNLINAWPERAVAGELELIVSNGISNVNRYKLKKTENFLLRFSSPKPELRLIGKGVIVPQKNSLEIPFESVGLNAVQINVIQIFKNNILQFFQQNQYTGNADLRKFGRLVYSGKVDLHSDQPDDFQNWNTYKVNLADLFTIEQGAIYRVEVKMKKEYSEFLCGDEKPKSELEETTFDEQETYKTEWDSPGWYSDYYYPPDYQWSERDNPCHVSYYYRSVSRNLLASDLGIIAKEGKDHEMHFVVTNLLTTDPEKGVQLSLYNFQNQLTENIITNENGFAQIELKKKPFFLLAQKGDQFGYLRLDDGSALSTSNFNVAGAEIKEGIKGFIYGERGVWRPGDTLFINFILEKENTNLPNNYPVVFQLINPSGQIVETQVQTVSKNNFYSFQPVTSFEAPTGNWQVLAKAGNVSFSKRVKIEAVKPNRLKIELDFPASVLNAKMNEIPITASWLHGTPARSLKTKVDVFFMEDQTSFEGFEKYEFTNPASNFYPQEQTIFDGKLDENGKAKIPLNFESLESAPGMVKAWFTSRVFEEGGDFSINVAQTKYAPFNVFVGVKMPDSEDNWYKTDTDYLPEIVLLDANGKPTSGNNIQARLYKINWRWWWESGSERLANYVSGRYYQPVLNWDIKNAKHKNTLKLNVKYNNWDSNGRYLLWVKDLDSGHASGTTFYMSKWGSWRSDDSGDGATMLSLTTDKEKYNVGEKIEVKIPSSKAGKALVSIENGTEVSDVFWVKTEDKQTTFYIDAKPEMAPSFYIHVSLIQPYGQTENDAPLRLYGVIPVLVEDPQTILQPLIIASDEFEPETKYTVKVSEANKKEMTYTLAIVDEGLLGLTNFVTPRPHQYFYAREALGVKTWDLYDFVAGAYGAKLEKAFAIGGDDDLKNKGKKNVSRFKPVVQFAGPFSLEKGKTNEHTFTMPNYVGAVRMMVVAGNKGAYGNAEKSVPVRKGLMLLATLPRILAPNEEVRLPVTVFAMKAEVENVEVKVKTNGLLSVEGDSNQQIVFDEIGEKMTFFNLKVNGKTGVAKVEIEAISGNEKASYEVELIVRNPNSKVTVETSKMIEGMQTWDTELTAPGETETQEAWIEISGFPSMNLSKHLDYLIRYPHGCIEQLTSSAFPQLFLENLTELSAGQKLEIEDHIRQALEKISAFQCSNGGFAYWPGISDVNEWGTNYAGHFILQAAKKGYSIPSGLKAKWLKYQKTEARNWSSKNSFRNGIYYRNYDFVQAYRLYTLALAGSPDLGAMNRLREKGEKTAEITWRLAAAYQLAGQPEAAEKLVARLSTEIEEYNEFGGTFGSALRDRAMILESLVLLDKQDNAFEMLKNISEEMGNRNWLSTQTAAWCLSSAAGFAEKYFKENSDTKFQLAVNGKKSDVRTKIPVVKIPVIPAPDGKIKVTYKNESENAGFIKIVARGIPNGIDSSSFSKNLIMKIKYLDANNQEINPSKLKQGEDFKLEITLNHPGERVNYEEMVLSTVFPSGWEIINRRLNDIPQNENSSFEYQDIRDDRVYTYFDLNVNQQKTFVFNLNASYIGTYYQPPVSCEAMYDFSVRAQNQGRRVSVVK